MKKIILTFLIALCGMNAFAQENAGDICENAIVVDTAYHGTLTAGEYWFTAQTTTLPLIVSVFPHDTLTPVPEVWIDLTCTPGVYEDKNVAKMLEKAGQYGLSFPMKEIPEKHYDKDSTTLFYSLMYDTNYRTMLHEQGVTYAIPAFIRVKIPTESDVHVVSRSVSTQCMDFVNQWTMNTKLKLSPADSVNVFVWPIGEWVEHKYRITWTSEGSLTMYDGTSCAIDKGQYVRQQYTMPKDQLIMDKDRTLEWVNEEYTIQLYTRLYPEAEGILSIEEIIEVSEITACTIAGVKAVIDNNSDPKTIKATLPAGTDRITAIRNAKYEYTAYNGERPRPNQDCSVLNFGTSISYDLSGVVVAEPEAQNKNTDATLSGIYIDGKLIEGFNTSTPWYDDVEIPDLTSVITATATSDKATVSILTPNTLPGMCGIDVVAEAGNRQRYTLNLIKTRSRNNKLSGIWVDGEPLEGFSPDELYYRMEVATVPELTAVAADSTAKIEISQAKQVPGISLIYVTAEAGNVETYSINFTEDPALRLCRGTVDTIVIDQPMPIRTDSTYVYRLPFKAWRNEYIRFEWSQSDKPLDVYLSTLCDFVPADTCTSVLTKIPLEHPKGNKTIYEYLFRPADIQQLVKKSADGNLYIRFANTTNGVFKVTRWVETCETTAILIEPGDTIPMNGRISNTIWKIYTEDFLEKDITFHWQGKSKIDMYFHYAPCGLKTLNFQSSKVLKPVLLLNTVYEGIEYPDYYITDTLHWQDWHRYNENGFLYAQFQNELPGTLIVEVVKNYAKVDTVPGGYNPTTGMEQAVPATFYVAGGVNTLTVRADEAQEVHVFTIDGSLVSTLMLDEGKQVIVSLPAGMYIVRGTQGARKAIVR